MHLFRRYSNRIRSIKCKGNISLLVIFVLLGSSLIALLAMHQIQNLLSYGGLTSNYFKAHYLAKAGLELALTETSLRDVGFEMGEKRGVSSGDAIVSGNLLTGYEGFEPYFTVEMSAQTGSYEVILSWGESLVIPLFLDTKVKMHSEFLTGVKKADLKFFAKGEIEGIKATASSQVLFGIFAFSGENLEEMEDMVTQKGKNLESFWNNGEVQSVIEKSDTRKYLTIVNESSLPVSLKIISSQSFALPDTVIEVNAHYGDTEVWLWAVFSEPFPNFLQGVSWDATD